MFGTIVFIFLGLSMIGIGIYQIIGLNSSIESMRSTTKISKSNQELNSSTKISKMINSQSNHDIGSSTIK